MKRLAAAIPQTDNGRALALGFLSLMVGLFLIWPPLAFVVAGVLFLAVALMTKPPEAAP